MYHFSPQKLWSLPCLHLAEHCEHIVLPIARAIRLPIRTDSSPEGHLPLYVNPIATYSFHTIQYYKARNPNAIKYCFHEGWGVEIMFTSLFNGVKIMQNRILPQDAKYRWPWEIPNNEHLSCPSPLTQTSLEFQQLRASYLQCRFWLFHLLKVSLLWKGIAAY